MVSVFRYELSMNRELRLLHRRFLEEMAESFNATSPSPIPIDYRPMLGYGTIISNVKDNSFQIFISSPSKKKLLDDNINNTRRQDEYTCVHETAHYLHVKSNLELLKNIPSSDCMPHDWRNAAEFIADYASIIFLDRVGQLSNYADCANEGSTSQSAYSFYASSSRDDAEDVLSFLASRSDLESVSTWLSDNIPSSEKKDLNIIYYY